MKDKNKIAIIGHVDHGATVLAASIATALKNSEVEIYTPDEAKEKFGDIDEFTKPKLEAPSLPIEKYRYDSPLRESRAERRKKERQKNKRHGKKGK